MIPFPRQQRWEPQQQSESKLTILIDCSKNIVSTMQITIRIMTIMMTIVMQQSPSITTLEMVNLNICIGNTSTKSLVDSGSVCTIINKSLASAVASDCKESFWVQAPEMQELKTFSNDLIRTIGVIKISIKCNDWVATGFKLTVTEDGHRPIIGRDLFPQLGFLLTQTKQVANVDQNQCLIKKQIAFDFLGLISRIGKSFKHSVKTMFHKDFTHQKGRRFQLTCNP